jgi:hypothetical protein
MVWVELLKKTPVHPHHRLHDDPHFHSDALNSYSTTTSDRCGSSQKCLNEDSLRARTFNLIQIKKPVPNSQARAASPHCHFLAAD